MVYKCSIQLNLGCTRQHIYFLTGFSHNYTSWAHSDISYITYFQMFFTKNLTYLP